MKRTTSLAMGTLLLALTAAFAAPAMARDEGRGNGHGRGHDDRGYDRRGDDRGDRGRGHDRDRDYGYGDSNRRGNGRGHDRHDDRRYYVAPPRYRQVYYAPRPVVRYGGPGYYAPPRWARGQRYHGPGYGPTYVVHEYRPYGLRAPPRGHYWRRSDAGDFLLVAAATGIIADLILHR